MKKYLKTALLSLFIITAGQSLPGAAVSIEIKDIKAVQTDSGAKIEVSLDKTATYKCLPPLNNPPRVIINLFDVKTGDMNISADIPGLKTLKVSQFSTRPKLIAQIVAELVSMPDDVKAAQNGNKIDFELVFSKTQPEPVVVIEAAPAEVVESSGQQTEPQPAGSEVKTGLAAPLPEIKAAEPFETPAQAVIAQAAAEGTEPAQIAQPAAIPVEVNKEEVPAEKIQEAPVIPLAVENIQAAEKATAREYKPAEDFIVKFGSIAVRKDESLLKSVYVRENEDGTELRINLSSAASFSHFVLKDPYKLVVDISKTVVSEKKTVSINRRMVNEIRAAQYEGRPKTVTRLVFGMSGVPAKIDARKENNSIIIFLSDGSVKKTNGAYPPAAAVVSSVEEKPAEEPSVKTVESPVVKPEAELKNDQGVQIAPVPVAAKKTDEVIPSVPAVAAPPERKKEVISLDFRDAEIGDIIRILAKKARLNTIGTEEVRGKVTIHLDDVDPKDALDIILKLYGYSYELEGENIFRIVKTEAKGKTGEIIKEEKIYTTKSFVIKYAKASQMMVTISRMLSKDGIVQADDPTNTLILIDTNENIDAISRLIEELDLAPKQVSIEVKFAEISNSSGEDMSTIWNKIGNPGTPISGKVAFSTSATGGGLGITVSTSDLEAIINMLKSKTNYNLISQPQIVCMDNREATIQVGSKVPYKQISTTSGAGGTLTTTDAVIYMDVGVLLKVTPHITGVNSVILDMEPQISTYHYSSDVPGVPVIDTRQLNSRVLIFDGQTLVVGGLITDDIRDSEYKVPLLGDIPLIGALFKYTSKSKSKINLVIFITPHIVK